MTFIYLNCGMKGKNDIGQSAVPVSQRTRVGIPASLNVFSGFLFTTAKVVYLVF